MTVDQTFGAWLRSQRRRLDLTQQALADQSSCSVFTIRKIEQGERRPSKQLAELLATALLVPIEHMADFVTFARQDPDSTYVPAALYELGHAILLPTAGAEAFAPSTQRQSAASVVRYSLPRLTTSFLGRETEIAALLGYLDDPDLQLVSILGPGGMGKTRLALAVADRLTADSNNSFVDGIVFVSLAALTKGAQIAPAIADALAMLIDASGDTAQQVLAYLFERRLLLIIDNCEHLLDGIHLFAEIVLAAPDVRILATSRERLHLQGEQVYAIEGLGLFDSTNLTSDDAMAHPAVRLFQQSAQRAAPTFSLTVDSVPQVARICQLVSGIPLGIELSAGWVGIMSLAEIADEIQGNLDFLSSDLRDLPARHRSIRTVFDASWQHLDPVEQSVFRRLSVFRNGFSREAAADVAGASLRHLGHLIYKSLLHYDRERNRYWFHELLHQYGTEKLADDAAEARTTLFRHCDYFVERLKACFELLKGKDQVAALAELDDNIDNFRLAWSTVIERGEAKRLCPAMDTMGFYLDWRVHPGEGLELFQHLVDAIDPDESGEARIMYIHALAWQASFLRQSGKPDIAIEQLAQAKAHCDYPTVDESSRRFQEAFIAYQEGYCFERRQNERALTCFHQCVEQWKLHGDPWWLALGLGGLGFSLSWSNHFTEGRERLSDSIEIFERYGHVRELSFLHNRASGSCIFRGDFPAARYHAERALALAKRLGNRKELADALGCLATIKVLDGNQLSEAEALTSERQSLYRSLGVQLELALSIIEVGRYRLIRGEIENSKRFFLDALERLRVQKLRQGEGFLLRWLAITAAMEGRRAEATDKIERSIEIFAEVGAYNYIPNLEIIRYLINKESLSLVQAKLWLTEILRKALRIHEYFDVYWSLSAMAYVLLVDETLAEDSPLPPLVALAAEIRGFVRESLEYGQSAYMCALVHDDVEAMLAQWPRRKIEAARARGSSRELWTFAAGVLEQLTSIA